MATYKNPFKSRFADSPGLRDSSFLSMYAPELIKAILEGDELLSEKATWIIGIPGSGKSSIMRLFCVEILKEILKNQKAHLHLYEPLVSSNIIVEDQIKKAGLYIPIDEIFTEAANVNLEKIDNIKLFFTLFDLRVAKQLAAILREIAAVNETRLDDLIIHSIDSSRCPPKIFSDIQNIHEFEDAVIGKEQLISEILTSFPGEEVSQDLELHHRISCLDLIEEQQINHKIKFILMVDDVHELYDDQLKALKNSIERRASFPRWIASRKHIYPIEFLVDGNTGLTDGRDVNTFDIDQILSKNKKLYRKFIKNLIDKRLKHTSMLSDFTVERVESLMLDFDTVNSLKNDEEILKSQKRDLLKIEKNHLLPYINNNDQSNGRDSFEKLTPLERELYLILAQRSASKRQLNLFPEPTNVNVEETASKDKQAAELFLKKRLNLPLYTGMHSILDCSNNNVEQFLRLFSPFVDRLIYKVELGKTFEIDMPEQSKMLTKASRNYTDFMIGKLLHGRQILRFVENMGRFFNYRTYESNAPHAPGITQFAIGQKDMELITSRTEKSSNNDLSQFLNVMRIAISNNVIVPEGSQLQGAIGSGRKYIFSLNRLLCIRYELPLQKGDFQLFALNHLIAMSKRDYKPEEIKSRNLKKQYHLFGD